MFVFRVLVSLLIFETLVFGVPVVFDEGDGDGYPDYDTFKTLELLGDRIFGEPRPSSGEFQIFIELFKITH